MSNEALAAPPAAAVSTLNAALARAAAHPIDPAGPTAGIRLVDRRETDHRLSWRELAARAARAAGALRTVGVAPADRVALVLPTGTDFLTAFFGLLHLGATPVPLPPSPRLARTDSYLRRTAALARAAAVTLALAPGAVRDGLSDALAGAIPVVSPDILPEGDPVAPFTASPDSPALIQFSSGTTSDPRPIVLSHRALLSQAEILNGFWPDDGGKRPTALSWLPLFHDMGLIGCVLPALTRPSVLTLLPPELFAARPAAWLRALSRHRATISPAPGFAFSHVLERVRDDELEGVDLSAWQAALVGAEPVAPGVLDAFAARMAPYGFRREALTPVYGLAEAALAVTFSDLDRPYRAERFDPEALRRGRAETSTDGRRLLSVGRPVPGFEISLLEPGERPEGQAGRIDRVGRVWVRGPSLMTGYLDRPDATAEVLTDGWLDTGDLGFLHDGELYLTGRAKDLILLRGRNHAPEDLERAALDAAHRFGDPFRAAVAVSRWPDTGAEPGDPCPGRPGRESLWLLLELRRSSPLDDLEQVAAICREAVLGETGLPPDHLVIVEPGALPRTSSGKLRRSAALDALLAGALPVAFESKGSG